jgi:hypothetical protein
LALAHSWIPYRPKGLESFSTGTAEKRVLRYPLPVTRYPLPVTRRPSPVARCPLPVARCPLLKVGKQEAGSGKRETGSPRLLRLVLDARMQSQRPDDVEQLGLNLIELLLASGRIDHPLLEADGDPVQVLDLVDHLVGGVP